jgi:hypothetical protein
MFGCSPFYRIAAQVCCLTFLTSNPNGGADQQPLSGDRTEKLKRDKQDHFAITRRASIATGSPDSGLKIKI